MNGVIDIGQAEGAFMMGLGYWLLEKVKYDPQTGKCLTNGTWEYKPPTSMKNKHVYF
jgi:xanthine dehydrogenase/oxidase